MKGEKAAMKIFDIVKRNKMLPADQTKLEQIQFIGPAALAFYRAKLKLMTQLGITEKQRDATLADGQDAGEMLLDVEVRLGEIYQKVPKPKPKNQYSASTEASVKATKSQKIGRPQQRISETEQIAKNPKIVAQVKAQAKKREDIPTKTAVINEIRYQRDKERRDKATVKRQTNQAVISMEQRQYLKALEKCITVLPQKPPKSWNESALTKATAKAKIIIKRLEVFNG